MTESRFYEHYDANVGEWMIRERSKGDGLGLIRATADDAYWAEQVALALNAWVAMNEVEATHRYQEEGSR